MKYVALLFLTLFAATAYGNDCTKSEILRLVDKGFTKSEINEICNETLKSPKCCCAIDTYQPKAVWESKADHKRTYKWGLADSCSGDSTSFWDVRTVKQCSSASYCGR